MSTRLNAAQSLPTTSRRVERVAQFSGLGLRLSEESWTLGGGEIAVEGPVFQMIELQENFRRGDWLLRKPGVPGTRVALQKFFDYGGYARRHLRRVGDAEAESLAEKMKRGWILTINSECDRRKHRMLWLNQSSGILRLNIRRLK